MARTSIATMLSLATMLSQASPAAAWVVGVASAAGTASGQRSSCDASMAAADVPSIVVGGGRIGSMLASLGETVLLKRGDPFPAEPASGPIYVCTRNDALAGIVDATPAHRREDLVFLQNGMLGGLPLLTCGTIECRSRAVRTRTDLLRASLGTVAPQAPSCRPRG
jgi:hypothetical protein